MLCVACRRVDYSCSSVSLSDDMDGLGLAKRKSARYCRIRSWTGARGLVPFRGRESTLNV